MNDEVSRVPFSAMATGFHQAVERFKAASPESDPVAATTPLFEALNWAVALDERVRKDWAPDGVDSQPGWNWPVRLTSENDAEAVRGIRFVRNRVHHQWADAIRLAQGGSRYPPQVFQWVWVQANELPAPDDGHHERGREGYERILENRPADFTLAILAETYHFMVQLLEPFGPAPRWRHNAQTG